MAKTSVEVHPMSCCGINELSGVAIGSPKDIIISAWGQSKKAKDMDENRSIKRSAFAVITEPQEDGYDAVAERPFKTGFGKKFAEFVRKNKLGNIIESNNCHNWMYGEPYNGHIHGLKVYLWEIDHNATAKFVNRHAKNKNK